MPSIHLNVLNTGEYIDYHFTNSQDIPHDFELEKANCSLVKGT